MFVHNDEAQRDASALENTVILCETLNGHSRDVLESRMLQNE